MFGGVLTVTIYFISNNFNAQMINFRLAVK